MAVKVFTRPSSLEDALLHLTRTRSMEEDRSAATATTISDGNNSSSRESARESLGHIVEQNESRITFSAQHNLPRLPIPNLEDTCRRYVDALRPLESQREHEDTIAAVHEFLKIDGPELQMKLKKYASDKTSYIEQFWYDSYLNFDNPVVLNLNPFFLLEDDPTPARNNQVTRAASLVISALSFVRAVRREELPPDNVRGTPLCMFQYSRLFGTARIPTDNGCMIGQDPTAQHIVVICRGQFYWFDVLDDNSDLIMTEKDVVMNLWSIIADADETPIQEAAKGALGVLSTENRKVWSRMRDVLTRVEGSNNSECLGIVDSALFVLCLDDTEPQNLSQLCTNMLCGTSVVEKGVQIGTCTNRWYDKLQIIVCKNGSAGINFEHTSVDGHTVLRFASDVYTDTILRFARTINGKAPSLWASTSPDPSKRDPASFGHVSTIPHKLVWNMVPELGIALRFAETRLADLIEQSEFECLDFNAYGKNFITSMGLSPDAFVQMAFQAAYYGLYGRVESTYEPAMTKAFLHGRTEAIRTVSDESVKFVTTFWADESANKKVDALKKACVKHVTTTKNCAKAQGQDRHLYALYCVWQRSVDDDNASIASIGAISSNGFSSPVDGLSEVGSPKRASFSEDGYSQSGSRGHPANMPCLFADAGWDRLNNTILSTSNCGNPSLRQFGFGPTSGDGFGIGYIIKEDSLSICASSKHRQTKRFVDAIESYLLEMRKLLRATQRNSTSPRASRARELDIRPSLAAKSQLRVVRTDGVQTPEAPQKEGESDDEELGGYGFFDSGMLNNALKQDRKKGDQGDKRQHARRTIGKRLRLTDY